jgi:enoyl-CoA hydratase
MAIVSYRIDRRVAVVTLSRPERRNALNHTALDELHEAVRRAASDAPRCVVVTGDQGHFCAGADLKELEDLAFTEALRAALDDLAALPMPTIAAIAGSCMGLGMQLALSCDLRLATSEARFAVPVAKLGLMVDHVTVQRLAMQVGPSLARWMMLSAEPVTAGQLAAVGFVQRLVDPGDGEPGAAVLASAQSLADRVSALAPLSLAGSKLGLDLLERPGSEVDPAGAYRQAFEAAWASDDLVEGRRAFAERRSPEFAGR